jgi:hypothetical protein
LKLFQDFFEMNVGQDFNLSDVITPDKAVCVLKLFQLGVHKALHRFGGQLVACQPAIPQFSKNDTAPRLFLV